MSDSAAHQAPPSLGFYRQEPWSGSPFPSPVHESENSKSSRSVVSDSSRPHGLQPTRLLRPWNFPGKSTGVGCHCFLHRVIGSGVKEYACQCGRCRRRKFHPRMGKILREENGNPLQYSGLGNPRDRGAWWAAVHGVPESRTGAGRPPHVRTRREHAIV